MSKREIANELHKPARKNFPRRRVNVYGKNDLWQADLVEMIPYSKVNGGYKYILVVIDCFTKVSWAKPLKSKSGKEVTSAMSKILLDRSPKLLQVDNGKEFYNTTFDALMSNSQASDTKRIISDVQSSNKSILNDVKLQQKEIETLKSNIDNLHVKIQLLENNIQSSNKSLLNYENRMSELFNDCAETSTAIAIQGLDVAQLKAEINRITGLFDENSLPNHGTYISDLNSRLVIIEGRNIKKT
ncbi:uncharacterized protein LOC132947787 [Metopolophium dirhodum]|uniref:uncharacterized protein LOC132947787 n=1 Tax=Metopolophium dirhodum TaxID=44670 RepID=UPI0029903D6C|nr:uncharacterized protein LOC132947787 [Metopolophium dirhodum]